jgi:hypothetical protein
LSAEQRARKFEAFADATGGGLIEVVRANGERALPSPSADSQGFPWLWIANVHEASISAESREEQGSVFRIAFPLFAGETGHLEVPDVNGELTRTS